MNDSSDDYHARMVAAVTKTVFDTSLIDIGGKPTVYIRSTEACEALISVMGMLMEGAPPCQTPAGMRKMSEAVGRNALAAMKAALRVRDERGRPAFGAEGVVIN